MYLQETVLKRSVPDLNDTESHVDNVFISKLPENVS